MEPHLPIAGLQVTSLQARCLPLVFMAYRSWRLILTTLVFGCSLAFAATPATDNTIREMVDRSNAFRTRQGLAVMQPSPELARAARSFADYMASTDRYGHEADGRQPAQRTEAAGYAHCTVAENIAWHASPTGIKSSALAETFVQGWIESPPHRRNLLAPEVTDIAIAVAHSAASGRWYAVQLLGRPASLLMRVELGNAGRQDVRYRLDGQAFLLAPGATRWHERCVAMRVEVQLPGARAPTVLNVEETARFRIDSKGNLRQLR